MEENSVKKTKKEDIFKDIEVLDYPNRTIPKLIEDVLEKDIPVLLSKNGYYIGGFYGLNGDTEKSGFALAKDTSEAGSLVFFDHKNGKHLVRNFEDLVKFNNIIWGAFFKISEQYKRPDDLWFKHMLEYGVLNITPGNVR